MKSNTNEFPAGWNDQRVREVLDYYESQTDDEALAEHAMALDDTDSTLMEVPTDLVPVFRQLIAEHARGR